MERLQQLTQLLVDNLCLAKYVVERLNQEMNTCGMIVVTKRLVFQSQGMYNIKKVYLFIKKKKNNYKIILYLPHLLSGIELN